MILEKLSTTLYELNDHAGGFNSSYKNVWLDSISDQNCGVITEYILQDVKYGNLKFFLDFNHKKEVLDQLRQYRIHPTLKFEKFLCSFNGSEHVSRKLLVAILNRMGWFDSDTCSKNFKIKTDELDGHLQELSEPDRHLIERKFFIGENQSGFFDTIFSFGHDQFNHARNIYRLESPITQCFLHLVSECIGTSYRPFISEKFLYSVVTRGLFLTYASPGWHHQLQNYLGFRLYDKIFDYRFDSIPHPVERLIELISMISKYSKLSSLDWSDLYEIEVDTIEYNYEHYFSGRYLECLKETCDIDPRIERKHA